jgi:hypothetical protein
MDLIGLGDIIDFDNLDLQDFENLSDVYMEYLTAKDDSN